jgi:uncharacterized membrane protein YqgA involved in biofilm formation
MKLQNLLCKLKDTTLKIADYQNNDLDRVGELMLALALGAAVTFATVVPFYIENYIALMSLV